MTYAATERSIGTLAAAARARIAADALLGVKTDARIIKLSTLAIDPREKVTALKPGGKVVLPKRSRSTI